MNKTIITVILAIIVLTSFASAGFFDGNIESGSYYLDQSYMINSTQTIENDVLIDCQGFNITRGEFSDTMFTMFNLNTTMKNCVFDNELSTATVIDASANSSYILNNTFLETYKAINAWVGGPLVVVDGNRFGNYNLSSLDLGTINLNFGGSLADNVVVTNNLFENVYTDNASGFIFVNNVTVTNISGNTFSNLTFMRPLVDFGGGNYQWPANVMNVWNSGNLTFSGNNLTDIFSYGNIFAQAYGKVNIEDNNFINVDSRVLDLGRNSDLGDEYSLIVQNNYFQNCTTMSNFQPKSYVMAIQHPYGKVLINNNIFNGTQAITYTYPLKAVDFTNNYFKDADSYSNYGTFQAIFTNSSIPCKECQLINNTFEFVRLTGANRDLSTIYACNVSNNKVISDGTRIITGSIYIGTCANEFTVIGNQFDPVSTISMMVNLNSQYYMNPLTVNMKDNINLYPSIRAYYRNITADISNNTVSVFGNSFLNLNTFGTNLTVNFYNNNVTGWGVSSIVVQNFNSPTTVLIHDNWFTPTYQANGLFAYAYKGTSLPYANIDVYNNTFNSTMFIYYAVTSSVGGNVMNLHDNTYLANYLNIRPLAGASYPGTVDVTAEPWVKVTNRSLIFANRVLSDGYQYSACSGTLDGAGQTIDNLVYLDYAGNSNCVLRNFVFTQRPEVYSLGANLVNNTVAYVTASQNGTKFVDTIGSGSTTISGVNITADFGIGATDYILTEVALSSPATTYSPSNWSAGGTATIDGDWNTYDYSLSGYSFAYYDYTYNQSLGDIAGLVLETRDATGRRNTTVSPMCIYNSLTPGHIYIWVRSSGFSYANQSAFQCQYNDPIYGASNQSIVNPNMGKNVYESALRLVIKTPTSTVVNGTILSALQINGTEVPVGGAVCAVNGMQVSCSNITIVSSDTKGYYGINTTVFDKFGSKSTAVGDVLFYGDLNCTVDADCGICRKCGVGGVCEFQNSSEDTKGECNANQSCINAYTYSAVDGFCNGNGACNAASYNVSAGKVCVNSTDYNVLASATGYCGIWRECVSYRTSANEYYVGYVGNGTDSCVATDWQSSGSTWNTPPLYMISVTQNVSNCSISLIGTNNTPPVITMTITPGSPIIDDTLRCNYTVTDANNDTLTNTLSWYFNNDRTKKTTSAIIDTSDPILMNDSTYVNLNAGSELTCEITSTDGIDMTTLNLNVTLGRKYYPAPSGGTSEGETSREAEVNVTENITQPIPSETGIKAIKLDTLGKCISDGCDIRKELIPSIIVWSGIGLSGYLIYDMFIKKNSIKRRRMRYRR